MFKFAGDAILVLWPAGDGEGGEELLVRVRRAAQCGMEIKTRLQDIAMGDGITLSMKVGVGVGEISILHVGGVFDRMEYIATGNPLLQAFAAEHQAMQRDVVISPQAWAMIGPFFTAAGISPSGYAILRLCSDPLTKVSVHAHHHQRVSTGTAKDAELMRTLGRYVPGAVLPYINHQEEKWASELRRITVLFVNLGLLNDAPTPSTSSSSSPSSQSPQSPATPTDPTAELLFIQSILHATQLAVYKYEGSLNKFLRDDKGSTLIAVFGLPPLAHEDDAVRGILAALAICARLIDLGLKPSVGVTTGMAFCGIVGTRGRREYSVLGDKVNLAARLMQHASTGAGGVLCDHETRYAAKDRLHFEDAVSIQVKGKAKPVNVYQPYPKSIAALFSYQGKRVKKDRVGSLVVDGGGPPQPPALTSTSSTSALLATNGTAGAGLTRGGNHHAFFEGRSGIGMSSIRSIFDIFKTDAGKARLKDPRSSMSLSTASAAVDGSVTGEETAADRARAERVKEQMRRRLLSSLDDPVKPNLPAAIVADLAQFADGAYTAAFFEQCQARRKERRDRESRMAISAPVPIPVHGSRLIAGIHEGDDEDAENHLHSGSDHKHPLMSPSPSSSSPSPQASHPPPPHPRFHPSSGGKALQGPFSLHIQPSHTPPLHSLDSTPSSTSTPTSSVHELDPRLGAKERSDAAAARRHSTPDLSVQVRTMRRPASSSNLTALDRPAGAVAERKQVPGVRLQIPAPPAVTHAPGIGAKPTGAGDAGKSIANASGISGPFPLVLRSQSFPDQDELTLMSAQPMGDSRRPSLSHSMSINDDKHFASPVLSALPSSASSSYSSHPPPLFSPSLASFSALPSAQPLHRPVTIILPDHISSLTLPTSTLPTLRQVKEEALLSLYRRGVLQLPAEMSLVSVMDEWTLCVERDGEEMRVADEMRVDSLTLQDRRSSSSLSTTSTLSSPSLNTSSSFSPAPLVLYLHHSPPSVTPSDQLQHFTEFIQARIAGLTSLHQPATLIVEGDVGLGKSKLLQTAVPRASYTPAHSIWTLANPFDSQRPLSVFRDVLVTLCDDEVMRVGVSEYSELSQAANRKKVIAQKLNRKKRVDDAASMHTVSGCLNEVITGLDLDETEETSAMSREERIQWSMLLLINVIHMVARVHPIILLIDEAVFLDHYSWQVILSLSRLDSSLLLILATRPINKSNMAAFQTQTPLEYTTLLQEQQTTVITLQPRSDEVIYQVTCEAFGENVTELPVGLAQFIIRKAHGNPLVVKELVYALTHDKLVEVDSGGRITMSPSLPLSSSSPHLLLSWVLPIPIPLTLSSILGSRLDRLGYRPADAAQVLRGHRRGGRRAPAHPRVGEARGRQGRPQPRQRPRGRHPRGGRPPRDERPAPRLRLRGARALGDAGVRRPSHHGLRRRPRRAHQVHVHARLHARDGAVAHAGRAEEGAGGEGQRRARRHPPAPRRALLPGRAVASSPPGHPADGQQPEPRHHRRARDQRLRGGEPRHDLPPEHASPDVGPFVQRLPHERGDVVDGDGVAAVDAVRGHGRDAVVGVHRAGEAAVAGDVRAVRWKEAVDAAASLLRAVPRAALLLG